MSQFFVLLDNCINFFKQFKQLYKCSNKPSLVSYIYQYVPQAETDYLLNVIPFVTYIPVCV